MSVTNVSQIVKTPGYSGLLALLEKAEGSLINPQKLIVAFAKFYASKGIAVFRLHVPLFDAAGEVVACSCEGYRSSSKCKEDHPRLYLDIGNGQRCENIGKHPMFSGINEATTDPDEIDKLFKMQTVYNVATGQSVSVVPNIGIATGPSGLLVLDADTYKEAYQTSLEDDYSPEELDTIQVETGGRGIHFYFDREDKPYKSATGDLPAGIDIRGVNNYVVAPPSLHKTGNRYTFRDGQDPESVELKPIPQAIDEILAPIYSGAIKRSGDRSTGDADPKAVVKAVEMVDGIIKANSIENSGWTEHLFPDGPGKLMKMKYCPFNDEHDPHGGEYEAYIGIRQDGALNAHCPHNRCQKQIEAFGSGWLLFRKIMSKPVVAQSKAVKQVAAAVEATAVAEVKAVTVELAKLPTEVNADKLIEAINAIGADTSLTVGQRAERLESELALQIGSVKPSAHARVRDALVGANAGFEKTDARKYINECGKQVKQLQRTAKKLAEEAKKEEEKAARRAAAEEVNAQYNNGDRPIIVANSRQLRDVQADCMDAIRAYNARNPLQPILYTRQGVLVRILRDENGQTQFDAVTESAMDSILSEVADWVEEREDKDGNTRYSPIFPSSRISTTIPNLGAWSGLPVIRGIVYAPTFGRNCKLVSEPGYDAETGLYYVGGVMLGDVEPTQKRVDWALDLIYNELLHDFPFDDQASKAHALALFLLGFVRPMINGRTPLHMFRTPMAGTGKGLLIDILCYAALGGVVPGMQYSLNEEEVRKSLTSMFIMGASHINIDNANCEINSAALNSAVTNPLWIDRILGISRMVNIPTNSIFIANGNNISASFEIERRSILIALDANTERPAERKDFKHEEIRQWTAEHRDELATAAIVLINNWIAKGKPRYKAKAKGSFEQWTPIMGGILEAAGVEGFLGNDEKLRKTASSSDDAIRTFVNAWRDKYADEPVSSVDLFKLASVSDNNDDNRTGEWQNLLGEIIQGTSQRRREMFFADKVMGKNMDRVFGGYKIVYLNRTFEVKDRETGEVKTVERKHKHWKLQAVDGSPIPPVVTHRQYAGTVDDPNFGETDVVINGKVQGRINEVQIETGFSPAEDEEMRERVKRQRASYSNGANYSNGAAHLTPPDWPEYIPAEPSFYNGNGVVEPEEVTWTLQ